MSKFSKIALTGLDAPQRMVISHPVTGLPLYIKTPAGDAEAFITVRSLDSKITKDFDGQVIDRRVQMRRRPTNDEFRQETLAKMAKLVAGGEWLIGTLEGEHIDEPCNESNARELFQAADWLLNQVVEFAGTLGNFVKN